MKKAELEQFNDKSKVFYFGLKIIQQKIYSLKLNRGYTPDKDKVNKDTKYFDREKYYDLIFINSNTDIELKANANKVALGMGLRNYSYLFTNVL